MPLAFVTAWLALALAGLGRSEAATAAVEEALRLDPDDPRLYGTLRSVCIDGDREDLALATLQRLSVEQPDHWLLTLNLGVTVAFEATMDYGIGLIGVDGSAFSIIERLLGHGLALGSIWTLFLIAYRYLPARRIPWRTAWVAATPSAKHIERHLIIFISGVSRVLLGGLRFISRSF